MADFAAVLRKTIDALKENTPEMRARVYEKARATIDAKLAAVSPPPSDALVQRQKQALEDAIIAVESEYAAPVAPPEESPADDLESIFAELKGGRARIEPAAATHGAPPVEPEAEAGPESEASHAPAVSDESQTPPEMPEEMSEYDGPEQTEPHAPLSDPAEQYAGDMEEPAAQDDVLHHDGDPTMPEREEEPVAAAPPAARRGNSRGFLVLALLVVVLAGTAFAAWQYRDNAAQLAGYANFDAMMASDSGEAASGPETIDPEEEAPPAEPEETAASGEAVPDAQQPTKFTQRLTPDGEEIDEGPAGGDAGLGEGTSVAEATQPGSAALSNGDGEAAGETADEPAAGVQNDQALPIGQKAIFYEERTSAEQGTAGTGAVVWSLVEESPGDNLPPEPAIHAEATIPEKNIQLKMTIRRNADQSLPASHIIELIFLTPQNFAGGGVKEVLRFSMKRTEQDTGSALIGSSAKIADGFFLVALSDARADRETNALLMRRQSWIDIPITYTSGRRALMTLEKGVPGDRIFNQALDAWARASSASTE